MSQLQDGQAESKFSPTQPFLFYSDLQGIEWSPPTMEKAICCIPTDSNVNLMQKQPYRHTWVNAYQISGIAVAQSG